MVLRVNMPPSERVTHFRLDNHCFNRLKHKGLCHLSGGNAFQIINEKENN